MTAHRITPPLPYAKPRDQFHGPRWAQDNGGPPVRGRLVRTQRSAPNLNTVEDNAELTRMRGPYWTVGNVIPLADPIRASEQGPERPRLHMNTMEFRRWMGTSNTRFAGGHTYLDTQYTDTLRGGAAKKGGMRGARMDRVTMQQYRGQTYSQMTRVLNG